MALPYFQRLQKEGESGRKKINQFTRYLTVIITAFQAPGYILSQVPSNAHPEGQLWWVTSIAILVAGTMFHYVAGRENYRQRYRQRYFFNHHGGYYCRSSLLHSFLNLWEEWNHTVVD